MPELLAFEIAEYIERGLKMTFGRSGAASRIIENANSLLEFEERTFYAGALGLALIGKTGDAGAALESCRRAFCKSPDRKLDVLAGLLGIPVALAMLIEINHQNGVSAREIAASLRSGTLGLCFRQASAAYRMGS